MLGMWLNWRHSNIFWDLNNITIIFEYSFVLATVLGASSGLCHLIFIVLWSKLPCYAQFAYKEQVWRGWGQQ